MFQKEFMEVFTARLAGSLCSLV